jgi:preprotein translocase subunit SecA
MRKNLLEYDDVANDQRKVVYHQRTELMAADDMRESIEAIREEVVANLVAQYIPPGSLEEQWDADGLMQAIEREFTVRLDVALWIADDPKLTEDGINARCMQELQKNYEDKEQAIGSQLMRQFEKEVMLRQLDHHWKEHLAAMDYLRQGIHLRGYAQKNPKQEYKREAFEMFGRMLDQIKHDTITMLSRVRLQSEEDIQRMEAQRRAAKAMEFKHAQASSLGQAAPAGGPAAQADAAAAEPTPEPFVRDGRKVGRNEPCPCGSGKKFKQCHGRLS